MTAPQLYWHMYTGYDPETDFFMNIVIGDCEIGPGEPGSNGLTPEQLSLALPEGTARYTATFDHEPTDEEQDVYRPDGHKSTDDQSALDVEYVEGRIEK